MTQEAKTQWAVLCASGVIHCGPFATKEAAAGHLGQIGPSQCGPHRVHSRLISDWQEVAADAS